MPFPNTVHSCAMAACRKLAWCRLCCHKGYPQILRVTQLAPSFFSQNHKQTNTHACTHARTHTRTHKPKCWPPYQWVLPNTLPVYAWRVKLEVFHKRHVFHPWEPREQLHQMDKDEKNRYHAVQKSCHGQTWWRSAVTSPSTHFATSIWNTISVTNCCTYKWLYLRQ